MTEGEAPEEDELEVEKDGWMAGGREEESSDEDTPETALGICAIDST